MTKFTVPDDDILEATMEYLIKYLREIEEIENDQFPNGQISLGHDSGNERMCAYNGSENGSLEVRVWYRDGWPAGERYVVKIESVVDGFADGTGYTGFKIVGSMARIDGSVIHDFSGYTNKHNVKEFMGW